MPIFKQIHTKLLRPAENIPQERHNKSPGEPGFRASMCLARWKIRWIRR